MIAETSWLVLDRRGTASQLRFVHMVTDGDLDALKITGEDWQRAAELIETCSDLRYPGEVNALSRGITRRWRRSVSCR